MIKRRFNIIDYIKLCKRIVRIYKGVFRIIRLEKKFTVKTRYAKIMRKYFLC